MKIKKIATALNKKLKGSQPFFIAVKNDSFIFFSDLIREIKLDLTCEFIQYDHRSSKKTALDTSSLDLKNKTVVFVFGKKITKKNWNDLKKESDKQGAQTTLAATPLELHL